MRRRARIEARLERLSVADTLRAIRFAETVILVIDALQPLERQDLTIANLVAEEGRALVLAANKWDLVRTRKAALARSARAARRVAAAAARRRARPGLGADRRRARRADAGGVRGRCGVEPAGADRRAQPLAGARSRSAIRRRSSAGRRLRLRYMTQVNTRPPTFALFASQARRAARNPTGAIWSMRCARISALPGMPIRLMLRKGENPYAPR